MAAFPTPSPEPDTHVISMDWFSRLKEREETEKLAKVRDQPQVEHLGYPLALGQPLRHPEPEMERTREPSDGRPPPTLKRQKLTGVSVSSGDGKEGSCEWREGDPGAGGGVSGEREDSGRGVKAALTAQHVIVGVIRHRVHMWGGASERRFPCKRLPRRLPYRTGSHL